MQSLWDFGQRMGIVPARPGQVMILKGCSNWQD